MLPALTVETDRLFFASKDSKTLQSSMYLHTALVCIQGGEVLAGDRKVWLPGVAVPVKTGRHGTRTVDTWRTGADQETGPCSSG